MTINNAYTFRCCSRGVQKCTPERRWPEKDCSGARFTSQCIFDMISMYNPMQRIFIINVYQSLPFISTLLPLDACWQTIKDLATQLLVKKVQQNFLLLVMLSLTCNTSSSDDGLSLKTLSRYPANLWDIQTVSLILRKRLFNNSSKRWVLSKSIFEGKAGLFLLKYEKKIKFYNLRWM